MPSKSDGIEVLQVCIPKTKRDFYDYLPANTPTKIGARVLVPFQRRSCIGVVLGKGVSNLAVKRLKQLHSNLDEEALLNASDLELLWWVAHYYQAPLSEVLALALPKRLRLGQALLLPKESYYSLAQPIAAIEATLRKNAIQQRRIVARLALAPSQSVSESELSTISAKSRIDELYKRGLLHREQRLKLPFALSDSTQAPLDLNDEQAKAVQSISASLSIFQSFLLQGVTGSGKTEVYLQVIEMVLAQGKQALIIVPEIGLTPQLISRFRSRFHVPMAVMHSRLGERERAEVWMLARAGELRLLIGTRTAVFTPMPKLGLIVIDEEHDSSLKQMDGVRYSARDSALMRAKKGAFPVILGTATPSLESLHNALQGKYQHLLLNQKALSSPPLRFQLVDLRNVSLQEGLAGITLQKIAQHLEANNQVLVFINRRGFAPVVLCHQCGTMVDCPNCDSHLTLHRPYNRLNCHHCGHRSAMPERCGSCQSLELTPVGVGTQRLEQFLQSYFPQYPLVRIDRDEVGRKDAFDALLQKISSGESQLIVGTQMLAKGHHFPNLTLAVILDTDAALSQTDFRATERLGQLLLQVSGRAGRAQKAGEVLIQTHQPQHPLLVQLLKEGYTPFAQSLLQSRKLANLPPWHYIALLRARDKNLPRLQDFMRAVKQYLAAHPIQILGPAPAPLARKAGEHQLYLLINSANRTVLQQSLTALRHWLSTYKQPIPARWSVDVDPQELA